MKISRVALSSVAVFALTLGALTGVGVLPATAATTTINNIIYSADPAAVDLGATVTGYSGGIGAVEIPDRVNISGVAYAVKTIGDAAFYSKSVTSVKIPASVTSIGNWAFYGGALPYGGELVNLTIPDGVISIGNYAFGGNFRLNSVSIGSSVKTIGSRAFGWNSALTSVTIPSSVTFVADKAFYGTPLRRVLFLGTAPEITAARTGTDGGSFGSAVPGSITLYYLPANASGITSPWNGYDTADASPVISGIPQLGSTLTAQTPGFTDFDRTYEWKWSGTSTVLGTSENYTTGLADLGKRLTVTVTASRAGYTSITVISAASEPVASAPFASPPTPTISGTSRVGQPLTAARGTWPADTTFTYAWKWSGTGTVIGTGETYTPVAGDLGKTLTVTVTASLPGYISTSVTSAPTGSAVAVGVFSNPTTSITGTAQVGKPLQAETGSWATGATLVYSWKRSGLTTPISAAASYTPVAADLGKTLTVTVTASRAGFTTAVVPSSATTAVVAGVFTDAAAPTITGTAQFGTKLTTTLGEWTTGATPTYAWKRSGSSTVISTAAAYTPVVADIGKTLSVTVTVKRPGFTTLTAPAAVTTAVVAASFVTIPVQTITGTKAVGSTLTAVTTGWSPSGSSLTFTYVWNRADSSDGLKTPITRATARTYKIVAADKGKYLTVTVTAKKTGYTNTSVTSASDATLIPS